MADTQSLHIDIDRLWTSLTKLGEIGAYTDGSSGSTAWRSPPPTARAGGWSGAGSRRRDWRCASTVSATATAGGAARATFRP
jgi:hypothetical protein